MTEQLPADPLLPCPLCGGAVDWCGYISGHATHECHMLTCRSCEAHFDLGQSADPKDECETLDALRARIVPIWNRRVSQ